MLQKTSSGRSSMYSKKIVGPRMEPWGTPALTGYSSEDFPSRNNQKLPSTERRRNKVKNLAWNSKRLSLWRRPECQSLSKVLDISSATAQVAPDLLKTIAVLSDTTVRRSAVNREDLKPYWKSEKHFSRWSTILLSTSFFQRLLQTYIEEFS